MKRLVAIIIIAAIAVVGMSTLRAKQAAAPTPPKPATPSFDKSAHSTTDPSSLWVIINKQHPLQPQDYAPADLVAVGNGQYMRAEAAAALQQMFAAAKKAGLTLTPDSAYRSYALQVKAYTSEVNDVGQAQADRESARPGYSEHQTGWAIDIGGGGCHITDCFGTTPEGKWLAANAYHYGFVQRYPAADSAITGYKVESWHYRYVGTTLSNEMHKEHIGALEQFFNVTGGPNYS